MKATDKLLLSLTGKKIEERDLGEYDGSGESRRFSAGKYTILANSIFDYSSYEQYYKLKIFSPEGTEYKAELRKERTDLWDIPIILSLDGDKLMVCQSNCNDNKTIEDIVSVFPQINWLKINPKNSKK